jgi:hypothetical protein
MSAVIVRLPEEKRDRLKALAHARRTLDNGIPVHSFQTLLQQLSTIVRNTCRTRDSKSASLTFQMLTTPDTTQRRALELLQAITV